MGGWSVELCQSEQDMAQAAGLSQASTASGQPYVSKLVLLGSSSVGKTSLALRYMKQDFSNVLPTVGCK